MTARRCRWRRMRWKAGSSLNSRRGASCHIEFTMPAEAQYQALPKIEKAIRLHAWNRVGLNVQLPLHGRGAGAGRPQGRPAQGPAEGKIMDLAQVISLVA